MKDTENILLRASRALDGYFKLADEARPLREAIGDALDLEKMLNDQRQQRDILASDIDRLRSDKAKADEQRTVSIRNAESDAIAIRSAAESWAADTRAQADRVLAEAKDKREEAGRVLVVAALQASAMVAEAKDEAAKIAAEAEVAAEKLAGIENEIAAVKAKLG